MKKFLSPQQFKLSKADLAPQKEISESPEDETQSDMGKLQVQMNSVNQPNDWRISLPLQNQPRRVRLQTTERPVHRRLLGESRKNVFVDKQRRGRVLQHNDDRLQRNNSAHEADPSGVVGVNLGPMLSQMMNYRKRRIISYTTSALASSLMPS